MNKLWQKIMLFGISLILGVILMTQIQTTNVILGNGSTKDKASDLSNELAELALEKNRLREELDELKEDARENEDKYEAKEAEVKRLSEELEKQKILSGYYDVKGTGTIITIDSAPDSYVSLAASHQYILALISYLNNAGVEAISINGQRYTNYTEIVPVLEHININGVAMVLPLEIKAIGNPRTIEASLNFVGGIVSQLTQIGYTVEIESSQEIFINAFDGEKEFRYAEPITADEEI
ncbi:MAG TPA: division initiation protein [Clostridiales bacterium]|nr:division initiation protein [Clostridiales bacterium]